MYVCMYVCMQVRSLQRSGEAKSTESKGTFEESKGSSRSHHSIRRDEDRRAASRIDRMQDLDDLTESIAPSPRAIPEAIAQRHYAAASLIKPPTAEEGGDMHACMHVYGSHYIRAFCVNVYCTC